MDFDSAFFKTEKCNWADEVDREFSAAGTEDKFSQCSQDTWLYYSTSSTIQFDEILHPKARDRSSGRGKQRRRNRTKASKEAGNARHTQDKAKPTETARKTPGSVEIRIEFSGRACLEKGSAPSATVVAMVQSRRKDFESCAVGHAWSSNFDAHKKQHEAKDTVKKEASNKNKDKQRKVVHQVLDGAVLVVTRRSKASSKTPTPIKQSKKIKNHPQPSPPPSRSSRADSSSDWKSDKRPNEPSFQLQIAPSKDPARFFIGETCTT